MKFSKILRIIVAFTILSLVYVQLQVQIYSLGYQTQEKKAKIQKLIDDKSDIVYNIFRLKSANNLGVKLLSDNSGMQFLDHNHIVKLETPVQLLDKTYLAKEETTKLTKRPNLLASIFSLKSQAEAEPVK